MTNEYLSILQRIEALWGSPGEEHPPEPRTEAEMQAMETLLGHPLPPDYRECLRLYGGCILKAVYPMPHSPHRQGNIFVFYGGPESIAEDYHRTFQFFEFDDLVMQYPGLSLVRETLDEKDTGWPPELLRIAEDMGGNMTCLALFGLRPGAVFYWRSNPWEGEQNVYLVADSFNEFMQLLGKDE